MLVLSRRSGEEVLVPQYGIVLTILDIQGEKVRVGISAHADVRVYRREVWDRIVEGKPDKEAVLCAGSSGKPRKKG